MLSLSLLLAQPIGVSANFMKKVTYDADDASLSSILTALSKISGANIVLAVETSSDKDKKEEKKNICSH
jgi:hypothetical protein